MCAPIPRPRLCGPPADDRKDANTGAFFDQEMDDFARDRRAMEHDLRHAVARGELYLEFQPLAVVAFASVVGYEALPRWNHPMRGAILPEAHADCRHTGVNWDRIRGGKANIGCGFPLRSRAFA